jgi:predicted DNA-binding transcriptional regulator AlpA
MRDNTPRHSKVLELPPDHLVPDRIVRNELGDVSLMTIYRWTNDPTLGFPPPIKIRNKNFRSRRAIEEFKARMMRAAVTQRVGG